jgi:D-alanyl-D-alanine carboxypeptidase
MQLVAEGRMRLSDPVERWLPGQLPYGGQVNIRQLLNHTSGIPNYWDLEFVASLFDDQSRRYTPQELLARVEGRPLMFAPGTAAAYINTSYVLLGLIVQRVTGQPFEVALHRRIIAPLGLTDTSFDVDRSFPAPRVHGYSVRVGAAGPVLDVTRMNPSHSWGSGNVVSSTRDLATFLRALMTGAVVRQPYLDQMRLVDPIAVDVRGTGFGLGLERVPYSCDNYGKNGSVPGYLTLAQSTPDGRRQVVWAANSTDWLLRPGEPVLFIELHAAFGQLLCEGRPARAR